MTTPKIQETTKTPSLLLRPTNDFYHQPQLVCICAPLLLVMLQSARQIPLGAITQYHMRGSAVVLNVSTAVIRSYFTWSELTVVWSMFVFSFLVKM